MMAEYSNNYGDLSDTGSELHCETTRTGCASRHSVSDSRQFALSVAKPSDAELERAIVQAVTAGAFDVARVLAARLDERRRQQRLGSERGVEEASACGHIERLIGPAESCMQAGIVVRR
jgi:hypothetical protein